jgi:tRNA threonylcarbamoyladenosine biosynthesis protein TsaB
MSLILGIDTSSVDLGIGLYKDLEPLASYSRFIRNSHAEHITQIVDMFLNTNGVQSSEIDRIAISVGPGSFTGLRIGIAFVKGFCFLKDIAVIPVSSLEILSYTARTRDGRVIAAIDARNDTVFYSIFSVKSGKVTRISNDEAATVSDFKATITDSDIIVTDTMGFSRSTVFEFLASHPGHVSVEQYHLQRGLFCASIGADAFEITDIWKNATEIVPNYLRTSSAQKPSELLVR